MSPRELFLLAAPASGALPLRLGGKAKLTFCLLAKPFAILRGFVPGDSRDGLLRMIEIRIVPKRGRQSRSCAEEDRIFSVRELRNCKEVRIDPYAVDRAFAVLSGIRAHQKPRCGNLDQLWSDRNPRVLAGCGWRRHSLSLRRSSVKVYQRG